MSLRVPHPSIEKNRRIMTSSIHNMSVAEVRKFLNECRKKHVSQTIKTPMYITDVLSNGMAIQEFALKFQQGHHQKRHNKSSQECRNKSETAHGTQSTHGTHSIHKPFGVSQKTFQQIMKSGNDKQSSNLHYDDNDNDYEDVYFSHQLNASDESDESIEISETTGTHGTIEISETTGTSGTPGTSGTVEISETTGTSGTPGTIEISATPGIIDKSETIGTIGTIGKKNSRDIIQPRTSNLSPVPSKKRGRPKKSQPKRNFKSQRNLTEF
jgi:hypothetical protein